MNMKNHLIVVAFFIAFSLFSCKGESQKQIDTQEVAEQVVSTESLEEVNFEIEGMTCAFGCAKMIENKLGNAKGVDYARVDFEKKSAYISFDKTQQSKVGLKKTIEALVDGDTYKASEIINEQ